MVDSPVGGGFKFGVPVGPSAPVFSAQFRKRLLGSGQVGPDVAFCSTSIRFSTMGCLFGLAANGNRCFEPVAGQFGAYGLGPGTSVSMALPVLVDDPGSFRALGVAERLLVAAHCCDYFFDAGAVGIGVGSSSLTGCLPSGAAYGLAIVGRL